jgi:type IV pilus assembly protein PilB
MQQPTQNATSRTPKSSAITSLETLFNALRQVRRAPELQLGDILIDQGLLNLSQLRSALERQHTEPGRHLGSILVEMGMVLREDVHWALAQKFGIPYVDLEKFEVPESVALRLPADLAFQYRVIPIAEVDGRLVVAMENPMDWEAVEVIRFNTNLNIEVVMAAAPDISRLQQRLYAQFDETEALEDLDLVGPVGPARGEESTQLMEREAQKKPVVRLVNAIILQAISARASDVNIRPEKSRVNVFYRVDGRLLLIRSLHKTLLPAVVSRIKITGQMNIAERRLPQDGHARMVHQGRTIDLRISIIPTIMGESVVIRILDKGVGLRPLDEVGFTPRDLGILRQMMVRSYGMFLVTGPTGSGKSTTLYAILNEVKRREPHILTVEDPVEYDMEGVEQVQVHLAAGYTFAEALRHFLRHDPDVIMVGEIRDLETARIANKAALTGHLVVSTLHTNDAVSTITRLIDMGIEPYLVSAVIMGVMAQRLVRLICPECKTEAEMDPLIRTSLGLDESEVFYTGKGCSNCNGSGYRGRSMVYELLTVSPEIVDLINHERPVQEIREMAVSQGMVPLTQCALNLAREGHTSLDEVFAVRLD